MLLINADRYTPSGPDQIPTGEIAEVAGTPLDFRQMMPIGARLNSAFQQMIYAHGYDHNFVLNKRSGDGIDLCRPRLRSAHRPCHRLLHHRAGFAGLYQQRAQRLGGRVIRHGLSAERGVHAGDAAFSRQPEQAELSDDGVEAGTGIPLDHDIPLRDGYAAAALAVERAQGSRISLRRIQATGGPHHADHALLHIGNQMRQRVAAFAHLRGTAAGVARLG